MAKSDIKNHEFEPRSRNGAEISAGRDPPSARVVTDRADERRSREIDPGCC
ncbi:DNA-directed RNA polymerase II [Corchorus olitorius]|uniref:DNA-directed RNA polymerase II n=1 Tax=Corchorus olitorius TaxID=93759 RepID=A0A1R3HFV4_9ROSI|nr:DNA-directed RNA polymerase II [Corchorus olitorius]